MRFVKLVLGFVLLAGGGYGAFYFFMERNEFNGDTGANGIQVNIGNSAAPVGYYMNLGIALGFAIMAVAGILMIRATLTSKPRPPSPTEDNP